MPWRSRSPAETRAAAAALARAAGPEGLVVILVGDLGAGKTVFAKGLAEGLGIAAERVASPTFVIASEYTGTGGRRFVHVDAYRIGSEAELEAAGLLDWLAPGVLVAVEWGDRLRAALPADALEVRLAAAGPEASARSAASAQPAASARPGAAQRKQAPSEASVSEVRELEARAGGPLSAAALARWSEWRRAQEGGARDTPASP